MESRDGLGSQLVEYALDIRDAVEMLLIDEVRFALYQCIGDGELGEEAGCVSDRLDEAIENLYVLQRGLIGLGKRMGCRYDG